jgi:hypothetical protein
MTYPAERTGPEHWRRVRQALDANRHQLAELASGRYADLDHVPPTRLLCRSEWLPAAPVELSEIGLEWVPEPNPPVVDGSGPTTAHVRPTDDRTGEPFTSYADAIGALAPPTVFENRPAYRLLAADLAAPVPWLRFGPGAYFDGVNVGEAAAHELADAWTAGRALDGPDIAELPLRSAVGDPRDLARRTALPAISTLTIRHDRTSGHASFVLHWRDPAKVAHAGGLYQVMPVGVFQPVSLSGCALGADFDLWRGMVREFSEELLGGSEEYGEQAELDYAAWPFYRDITAARAEGRIRVSGLGIGVDPLTWATDILTVAVFDADCFDELFAGLVDTNAEGRVISGEGVVGMPFDDATLAPFVDGTEPTQAAGASVLALARRFRDQLLATR